MRFANSALLISCAACLAVQEPRPAPYRFSKEEVLVHHVESRLTANQEGTHPEFRLKGSDLAVDWSLSGEFENAVLDVEADGSARLERRVRQVKSTGEAEGEPFAFEWERGKELTSPSGKSATELMNRFVAGMVEKPEKYRVDSKGAIRMTTTENDRLVMRRGMMFWPIRDNEQTWTSIEGIAVPVLHERIQVEFSNKAVGEEARSGYKVRIINAKAQLKEPRGGCDWVTPGLKLKVSGEAKIEFDLTRGRLRTLTLELRIEYSWKGRLKDGGEGDVRGVVTYSERQETR